jgi:hypothetical protein
MMRNIYKLLLSACLLMLMASCEGLFSSVYDEADSSTQTSDSQLYIDASSKTAWYYISFDSLEMLRQQGDAAKLQYAQTHFTPYPVPMTATGDTIKSPNKPDTCGTGIYTYWYDIFGKGLSVNKFSSFIPTASQPEPENWDIGIHYVNARTNGGSVLETSYTSIDDLPASSADFSGLTFTPDEWTENVVWADWDLVLTKYMGCQGIKINKVLSSWIDVELVTPPPVFTLNNHVFIVRLKNGKYAAVQLQNYMSSNGTKGCLTINYKYPY